MAINKRDRTAIKLGVALVAALLFYLLAVEPWVEGQQRVRDQFEAKTILLKKYRSVLNQRETLEEELELLEGTLTSLEGKLLGGEKPPLAAAELQKILKSAAEQAGVKIVSERILDPVVRGHYMEVLVEINVKCNVTKFTLLLFEIEKSPKYLSVKEMNVRGDHRINPKEVSGKLVITGLIRNPESI